MCRGGGNLKCVSNELIIPNLSLICILVLNWFLRTKYPFDFLCLCCDYTYKGYFVVNFFLLETNIGRIYFLILDFHFFYDNFQVIYILKIVIFLPFG